MGPFIAWICFIIKCFFFYKNDKNAAVIFHKYRCTDLKNLQVRKWKHFLILGAIWNGNVALSIVEQISQNELGMALLELLQLNCHIQQLGNIK